MLKYDLLSFSKIIFLVWFAIMTVVSGLLIAEFRFFKEQSQELEHLKDDYALYITTLKKLILEHDSSKDSISQLASDTKKILPEDNEETEPQFLVVNREPAYLKKSALSFARLHNIEWALRKMYEADSWVANTVVKKKLISRSKHALKSYDAKKMSFPYENEVKKLQREPLFVWPVEKSQFWLSSVFGPRKKPDGSWGFHTGIDMAAHRGTPVKAGGSGKVIHATYSTGYGNTVVIAHNRKFKTRYAHLDKIFVKVGQSVNQGEIIGEVGATGCVRKSKKGKDPSHLHFEVYVLNKQVNPFYFLA